MIENKLLSTALTIGTAIVIEIGEYNRISLHILQESMTDEGAYIPAQDISLYGKAPFLRLKEFCDNVVKEIEAFELATKTK